MPPGFLHEIIRQQFDSQVDQVVTVSGGSINQSAKVNLRNGQTLFVK